MLCYGSANESEERAAKTAIAAHKLSQALLERTGLHSLYNLG
jgi:hypothetical protein